MVLPRIASPARATVEAVLDGLEYLAKTIVTAASEG